MKVSTRFLSEVVCEGVKVAPRVVERRFERVDDTDDDEGGEEWRAVVEATHTVCTHTVCVRVRGRGVSACEVVGKVDL